MPQELKACNTGKGNDLGMESLYYGRWECDRKGELVIWATGMA